jgi:hypothetical protein
MLRKLHVWILLLPLVTGLVASPAIGDTIRLRDGMLINGTFLDTGICGVGVHVRPGHNYSVTRCVYEGSRGGIRLDFIDGRWLDLADALNDFDMGLSLKYCLEFNKGLFDIKVNIPKVGNGQTESFRSLLNTLMKNNVIHRYRKAANTKVIWFYMRFARIVDDKGREQYLPLNNVADVKRGFVRIIPQSEFLKKKERELDIQEATIGISLATIKRDKLLAIMFLPNTPDGPDWNLNYANARNTAIGQTLLRSILWHSTDIVWRRRYLDILHYAR